MTPDRLESVLGSFTAVMVAVIGDLMLDEFIWGDVSRISPDAPVQVVEIRRRSRAIGGAGNVAHNVAAAGGSVVLLGVTGRDGAAEGLAGLLAAAGIEAQGVLREEGRPTTVKTRIVARGQHLVRLDEEVRTPLREETRTRLLASVEAALPRLGSVLVSDYAKGVIDTRFVSQIAALARGRRPGGGDVPILVDPKGEDFSRYRGCFAITPNHREAEVAARMKIETEEDIQVAAQRIRAACGAPWVLITRGERGMALSGPDGRIDLIPARAREVYDVTGAGDIVMAYFGIGIATGLAPLEAATVANMAAGIGVAKVGTTAVRPAEILEAESGGRSGSRKTADLATLAARVGRERSVGRRVVFTNGCFDLLHAGHVHLLERARELGDFLVVAVNSDASVTRLKGQGRPLLGQGDRVRILSALDAVDLVVVFEEDTPLEVIDLVRPDVLVKGGDYEKESIVGYDLVTGYGGRVATIPLVSGRSTTGLIAAMTRIEKPDTPR